MIAYRTHTPPPTIEWLSPSKSHFNFNIEVEDVQVDEFENTETYKSYSYNQVEILNPVTKDKIITELKEKGFDDKALMDKVNDLEI